MTGWSIGGTFRERTMSGGQEGTGDADAPRPPENASTPVPPKGTAPATGDADSSITPPAGKVVSDDEKKTVVPSCRGAEHAGGASRALNAIIRSSLSFGRQLFSSLLNW